jgi:hypothetical protein
MSHARSLNHPGSVRNRVEPEVVYQFLTYDGIWQILLLGKRGG